MIPLGVNAYIGAPGTGKTYRAREDAFELQRAHGCGLVVIDSVRSPTLAEIPRADTAAGLLPCWQKNEARAYTPRELADFERIIGICADPAAGNVIVLVDEVFPWRRTKALVWLCRTWRASRCTVLLTTQHPTGDVMADLQAAEPAWYVFRVKHPRGLEWLEEWKGLDPDEIRELPDREFVEAI